MRLFLIAGEPSGDALGAALMQGLKALVPHVDFAGVGGPLMQAEGLESQFPMDELSIMGLAEVLPKYFHLKRRIRETAAAIAQMAPDAVITIDSPDFCLRVLALARKNNPTLRTIHYVAPSVWAWRPKRAQKMARVVNHVLALLSFEPPYMQAAGMSCDFVGHPVVAQPVASSDEAILFRVGLQVKDDAKVILCLPGSRKGEVSRLLPVFRAALEPVVAANPGCKVVIPTTPNVTALVRELTAGWRGVMVMDPSHAPAEAYQRQKRAAFRAADVALAASGTVSLELAASGTPMVIAYQMNRLSHAIIWRLLRVDTVTLVNLVSETRSIPEFVGPDECEPVRIAEAVQSVLSEGPLRSAQLGAMQATMERLGRGGEAPGLRAARSVLSALEGRRSEAQ